MVATGLLLVAPKVRDGLRRQSYNLQPLGGGVWMCEVKYGWQSSQADDDPDKTETPDEETLLGPEYNFDIGVQTVHITQSLLTVSRNAPPNKTAPDYHGAIGATRDGVAGCDVAYPQGSFSVKVQRRWLTLAYLRMLRYMTAKVNSLAWRGFAAGELRFDGASGSSQPGKAFEITYKFSMGENLTNIDVIPSFPSITRTATRTASSVFLTGMVTTVGIEVDSAVTGSGIPAGTWVQAVSPTSVQLGVQAITSGTGLVTFTPTGGLLVPSKGGWQYLWTAYQDDLSTDANLIVQRPVAAYVEQVYRTADFSLLEIGG